MPKKAKTPEFSDWHVALGDGSFSESLVARASSLMVVEGSYVLRDTYGGILFAAPAAAVRYIRRLEHGEDGRASEKPKAAGAPEPAPAPLPDLEPRAVLIPGLLPLRRQSQTTPGRSRWPSPSARAAPSGGGK